DLFSTLPFVSVYGGDGDGAFTPIPPPATFSTGTILGGGQYLAAGDFDQNGTPDLVVAQATAQVGMMLNTSTPLTATETSLLAAPTPSTYGEVVTLTAEVTADTGTATGKVT